MMDAITITCEWQDNMSSSDSVPPTACESIENSSNDGTEIKKRKYFSDSKEEKKKRNIKRKEVGRALRGQIEFSCSTEKEKGDIFEKIDVIKNSLGNGSAAKVSNRYILNEILDFYIEKNLQSLDLRRNNGPGSETCIKTPSYQYCNKGDVNEDLFLCTKSAISNLTSRINEHDTACNRPLNDEQIERFGHCSVVTLTCHSFRWSSSPRIEGGHFLANLRIAHGMVASGILPNQYQRFCDGGKFGKLSESSLDKLCDSYSKVVDRLARESESATLLEEIASGDLEGIDILTDARHCWRKNAKFSDVLCLGDITHKVLRVETISKVDDPCTQRHELIGIQRIYNYFDGQDCPVNVHCHDSNASVSKFIKTNRHPTVSTLDTWHATKNLSKTMSKITRGPKKLSGISWHPELADKAASVKTHVYHSMKNSHGDASALQKNILNIIRHYKNDHEHCFPEARCKSDENYISSKDLITTPAAEVLLEKSLKMLPPYRKPEDYVHCKDTHYVESFNNSLLQYHDKRIAFGKKAYHLRTDLSILDWNEHVGRPVTSLRFEENALCLRKNSGQRVLVKKNYSFRENIWDRWMSFFYSPETQLP